eukprot:4919517-Pyramimonas_sp.AAC.1
MTGMSHDRDVKDDACELPWAIGAVSKALEGDVVSDVCASASREALRLRSPPLRPLHFDRGYNNIFHGNIPHDYSKVRPLLCDRLSQPPCRPPVDPL